MVQEEAKGLPACIYRPSIVVSTYKEPVRGWTDNLNGPLGALLGGALGILHTFLISPDYILDVVPVDYVINSMIASAWNTGILRDLENVPVINFSLRSFKLTNWKVILDMGIEFPHIWQSEQAIWYYSLIPIDRLWLFKIVHFLLHKIPGTLLDKLGEMRGKKLRLTKLYDLMYNLKEQNHYFVKSNWEFRNENAMAVLMSLSEEDKELFNFDLSKVEITELFMVGKLGMRYYYLKEKMDTLPRATCRTNWLYWAHMTLKTVYGLVALKLMVLTARGLPI